jgi:predicted molibdopterin-dependent oxidoreductase YjgC
VCDEGGECQLQDLAFAFGHDFSRMDEAKRTFVSEDLGPVVKKEANRCIVCMRCVRYCDEIMGDSALTAHQRGVHTEISSFDRMPLDCEQCGNCIEVCPVGALTALPYRFKARPWDLRQHISVCPWCSNGCSVRLGVRGMEILRARGTEARGVNQEYLCVRGRFGYEFVNHADRLTAPLVRLGASLAPTTFDEAATFAASRLREIAAVHGPGAIAFLGGEKLNVEEQYLFQKLARGVLGTPHVDARTRFTARVPGAAILAATGGGRPSLTFPELADAQEALILGDDLQGEGPLAQATLIRGRRHRGLHLTVAHPRRVKLAREKFKGAWLAYRPGSELALVFGLTVAAIADGGGPVADLPAGFTLDQAATLTGVPAAELAAAARRLRAAERKALVFGRAFTEHPQAHLLVPAIGQLAQATGAITAERSWVMFVGPHAGSQGAADMGLSPDCLPGYGAAADADARAPFEKQWGVSLPAGAGLSAPEILSATAEGRIKALWIASDEWLRSAPDRALAERALEQAELVIVSDLFLTETARRAHVVFPAAAFAEKEGVLVNCERRLQCSARALPPRKGSRTDWEIVQAVAQALGAKWSYRSAEDVWREIARLVPGYQGRSYATLVPYGPQWTLAAPLAPTRVPAADTDTAAVADGLWVLTGGVLFQQGSLSHRTKLLPQLAKDARAWLHPDDARRLELTDGEPLELTGPSGSITVPSAVDASVPAGSVFVPYAFAEVQLNRLGAPTGAGLRARARRAAVPQTIGAQG